MGTGLLITLILGFATQLSQPRPTPDQRWPVSLEFTLGYGLGGTNGEYRGSGSGSALDALVGVRLRSTDLGAWVGAISFAGQPIAASYDDICVLNSDGGCVPQFPLLGTTSFLGGWETTGGAQRLLAGPGLVPPRSGDWRRSRLAWVLRLDAALPMTGRLSMIGSARGSVVPSYRGDTFWQGAIMAGLRLR